MRPHLTSVVLLAIALPAAVQAETTVEPWLSEPATIQLERAQYLRTFDEKKAAVYRHSVAALLQSLAVQPSIPSGEPLVIHAVLWADPPASGFPVIEKQNWYVYLPDANWGQAKYQGKRILGRKRIHFLYLYLNPPTADYQVRYEVETTTKQPVFLDHLIGLGGIFGLGQPSTDPGAQAVGVPVAYGYRSFDTSSPADVKFSAEVIPGTGPAVSVEAVTFDNEGYYHVDFSVGVPITKIKELTYVPSGNTLVPAEVERQKLFALFNWHPVAIDPKTQSFSRYPYFIAGVGIGSQPLQKVLIGAGWGPRIANFYAGWLLHTQRLPGTTKCGATPTAEELQGPLKNRTCHEFSFGLNVAVGSIADKLKSR